MPFVMAMLAVALVVLLPARDAHAYIDPGTGSLIIQIVVAGVLGAIFTIKLWYRAARRFVRRLRGTETALSAGESETAALAPGSGEIAAVNEQYAANR